MPLRRTHAISDGNPCVIASNHVKFLPGELAFSWFKKKVCRCSSHFRRKITQEQPCLNHFWESFSQETERLHTSPLLKPSWGKDELEPEESVSLPSPSWRRHKGAAAPPFPPAVWEGSRGFAMLLPPLSSPGTGNWGQGVLPPACFLSPCCSAEQGQWLKI